MKFHLIAIYCFLSLLSCNSHTKSENKIKKTAIELAIHKASEKQKELFNLWYSFAGLGSNMGSLQPTFKVLGLEYIYKLEQNSSFSGEFDEKPEFICQGKLRQTSIDSIFNLVKNIQDSVIYNTNIYISSGGIHYITIKYKTKDIAFTLHNATDTTAQKIVDILNSNIPKNKKKLWLSNFPDEKRD